MENLQCRYHVIIQRGEERGETRKCELHKLYAPCTQESKTTSTCKGTPIDHIRTPLTQWTPECPDITPRTVTQHQKIWNANAPPADHTIQYDIKCQCPAKHYVKLHLPYYSYFGQGSLEWNDPFTLNCNSKSFVISPPKIQVMRWFWWNHAKAHSFSWYKKLNFPIFIVWQEPIEKAFVFYHNKITCFIISSNAWWKI